MTLSGATDKAVYAPGELVTLTVSGAPNTTVNVTIRAGGETATTSYQVQGSGITVSDDQGGSWTQAGPATFTQAAPGSPAVPSGFAGPEPSAELLTSQGVQAFSWSGYTWEVEHWGNAGGTGPQPGGQNATVNDDGHLVLTYAGGLGAELNSARGDRGLTGPLATSSTWGYGRYRWVIGTDLSALPAPLVLGLFTFWSQAKGGPPGQKEIDFEASCWGNAVPPFWQLGFYSDTAAPETAAVPPEHVLIPGSQVPVKPAASTVVEFTWLPGSITWKVWYGADADAAPPDYTLTATQGQRYAYTEPYGGNYFAGTVEVPATGGQQVIMNLWTYGQVYDGSYEVVIESFSYAPSS